MIIWKTEFTNFTFFYFLKYGEYAFQFSQVRKCSSHTYIFAFVPPERHVWFSCQSSGILSPSPDNIRKYAHNERNIMDLGCILLNPIFCLVLDIQFPKTSKTDHWIYRLEIWIWKLWYWKLGLSLLSKIWTFQLDLPLKSRFSPYPPFCVFFV